MPKFSVQLHEAHEAGPHWDLRLEKDNAAKSFAIPKARMPDKREKVLAVQVEDHPLNYMLWEGTIPEVSYGAGKVSVYDSGIYDINKWDDKEIDITLYGKNISGRFVFIRTENNKWLIVRPEDQGKMGAVLNFEVLEVSPRLDKGSVNTFLNSRIHSSFTLAADHLYALGFMTTEERIALSGAIGDALKVFMEVVKQELPQMDNIPIPPEVAMSIIKDAILCRRTSTPLLYKTASTVKQDVYNSFGNLLTLALMVTATDEGKGDPIYDNNFPAAQGLFTDRMESLVKAAIGDEQHAISIYATMILGLETNDPNIKVLRELQFDEQVHERMLLRMLGNELPILVPPYSEMDMKGEAEGNKSYDKSKEWGHFFGTFTDLIHMAIGDERHAIALYNTIADGMTLDDTNAPVIRKIMTDEQDHNKKLLRMLGEKTPEPVEASIEDEHRSFSKCMDCDKTPEFEAIWADGRAHVWFCDKHFEDWVNKHETWEDEHKDIVMIKEITDCTAHRDMIDQNPNPNILNSMLKRLGYNEELVAEKQHSPSKCMECNKTPEYEVLWAEGIGHAWFCKQHLDKFIEEHKADCKKDGYALDIDAIKEIPEGVASKKFSENTNGNILSGYIKKFK